MTPAELQTPGACPICHRESEWAGPCDACVAASEESWATYRVQDLVDELLLTGQITEPFECLDRLIDADPMICETQPDLWAAAANPPDHCTLYIYGPSGTGKTYAGLCIIGDALRRKQRAAVVTGPALAMAGNAFNPGPRPDLWMRAPVLLLDDIEKGPWREQATGLLHTIFDYRFARKLPTIVTSNLDPAGFTRWLVSLCGVDSTVPRAIMDRMHPVRKIETRGASLRRKEG